MCKNMWENVELQNFFKLRLAAVSIFSSVGSIIGRMVAWEKEPVLGHRKNEIVSLVVNDYFIC